jgi:hypothetical protein
MHWRNISTRIHIMLHSVMHLVWRDRRVSYPSMAVSVVFLVAKSDAFVVGCVFVRTCTSATIRVLVYGNVSCMCTFKLNNLGKVTIIYILYILGKMVNLVKL